MNDHPGASRHLLFQEGNSPLRGWGVYVLLLSLAIRAVNREACGSEENVGNAHQKKDGVIESTGESSALGRILQGRPAHGAALRPAGRLEQKQSEDEKENLIDSCLHINES